MPLRHYVMPRLLKTVLWLNLVYACAKSLGAMRSCIPWDMKHVALGKSSTQRIGRTVTISPSMAAIRLQTVCLGLVGDLATTTCPFLKDFVFFVQNSTSTTSPSCAATCKYREIYYTQTRRLAAQTAPPRHEATRGQGAYRVEGREHGRTHANGDIQDVLVETVQKAAKLLNA